MLAEGGLCSGLWSLHTAPTQPPTVPLSAGLCPDLPRPSAELPGSEGMVDSRSQIYSRSQATQVPTAQTTGWCWRPGLLWGFTKQTEQLGVRGVLTQVRATVRPWAPAGRSRGLGGLQDGLGRTPSRAG